MCKQLQPTVPSLYQIKNTKLPGYIPPTKVTNIYTNTYMYLGF